MLNLQAKTKPQELILAYLQKNASEELIEKINNGVQIEKDGVHLISKKTLDGFMTYANGEARKLAEQGSNAACVEDSVVYGWAMHYFEESSIEGTLYNLDGTEYKPPKKEVKRTSRTTNTTSTAVKKEPKQAQFSLFDMMTIEEQKPAEPVKTKPTIDEILDYNIDEDHDDDEDEEETEEFTEEEIQEVVQQEETETVVEQPKPKTSATYEKYLELEKQNPTAVVVMRLGDFYEVFGGNAIQIAGELNLTLTGRDFGYPERIPMIGFPYHAADNYFLKIHAKHDMLVCETGDETTFLPMSTKQNDDGKHWVDENTYVDDDGVIHEVKKEVKTEIPDWLVKVFNNKVIVR